MDVHILTVKPRNDQPIQLVTVIGLEEEKKVNFHLILANKQKQMLPYST